MSQDKGKLHPKAGNTSRPTPLSTQQHASYANAASNRIAPFQSTMPPPRAVPSASKRVNTQVPTDVPGQLRGFQVQVPINRQRPWKNKSFNISAAPTHVPEEREVALKKYQQIPSNPPATASKGFLVWPKVELPRTASTSRRELDEIRLQLNCHIAYDSEMEAFKILSGGKDTISGEEAVESALVDVRKRLQQKGKNLSDTLKIFLARLPEDHTLRLVREYARDHKLVNGLNFADTDVLIRLKKIDGAHIPTNWTIWSEKLESVQVAVFKHAMFDRWSELQSMGESVHLRVRTGMCVFKNYLWESNRIRDLPIIAFVESFEHDKTDAVLCPLNDSARLMENIQRRKDVLNLTNIEPLYEVLFDVASKGESRATHQLHVSASSQGGSAKHERNWRKFIDRDRVGQALEVFMVKFGGEQSWKLHVDATPRVSIPGDEERNFAASVQLKAIDKRTNLSAYHGLCFDFQPNNNIHIIRQKIIWRTVLLSNSRWVIELAKYDDFVRNHTGSSWMAAGGSRWDISMYHRKWNMISALDANQESDKIISSLLSPDESYPVADEAVKGFCKLMDQVSDSLSFWPRSVVE